MNAQCTSKLLSSKINIECTELDRCCAFMGGRNEKKS